MSKTYDQMVGVEQRAYARFSPTTHSDENRTIDVVWTTGAAVKRYDWWDDQYYMESLRVDSNSVDLTRLNSGAPFLLDHDASQVANVIGVIENVRLVDGKGLATIRFSARDDVTPIWEDVKSGILRNVSVGYRVDEYKVTIGGMNGLDLHEAVRWTPYEVSLVTVPADVESQFRSQPTESGELRTILRKPEARKQAEETPSTESLETREEIMPDQKPETIDTAALAAEAAKKERQRVIEINDLVRKANLSDDFARKHIEDGSDISIVRAAALDALVTKQPDVSATTRVQTVEDQLDKVRDGIKQAILNRVDPEKHKIDDKARHFRGMTFLELGREYLRAQNRDTSGLSRHDLASAMMTRNHSTSDFPIFASMIIHSRVADAYKEQPQTFRAWASQATLSDFRDHHVLKLTEGPDFKKVLENGEFVRGTFGESKNSYHLETFGRTIGLTRQGIINDQMGVFGNIPQMMGRAAARLESKVVYDLLLSNPTMAEDSTTLFATAHGNVAASGGALTLTTLTAGVKAMRKQKVVTDSLDPAEDSYLDLNPAILLVGPESEVIAKQLMSANYQPTGQTGINIYTGAYQVVVDARITDNSWYLLADRRDAPVMEYAYLSGNEGIFMDTEIGFHTDTLEYKFRLDFGAGVVGFQGAYKNAGA